MVNMDLKFPSKAAAVLSPLPDALLLCVTHLCYHLHWKTRVAEKDAHVNQSLRDAAMFVEVTCERNRS